MEENTTSNISFDLFTPKISAIRSNKFYETHFNEMKFDKKCPGWDDQCFPEPPSSCPGQLILRQHICYPEEVERCNPFIEPKCRMVTDTYELQPNHICKHQDEYNIRFKFSGIDYCGPYVKNDQCTIGDKGFGTLTERGWGRIGEPNIVYNAEIQGMDSAAPVNPNEGWATCDYNWNFDDYTSASEQPMSFAKWINGIYSSINIV